MKQNLRRIFPAFLTLVLALGLYSQQPTPSLLSGIDSGAVTAEFVGTGGSSGDSVKVRVSRGPKALPGPHAYSVPPGSSLASSDSAAQSMMVLGVEGRETGPVTYAPTSTITIPAAGSATYILRAFCAEFHKDNPSESTHFSLHEPDKVLTCIARNGPTLSDAAFQAAVWMYTDHATFAEVNEKFDVTAAEWAQAGPVYRKCQPSGQ